MQHVIKHDRFQRNVLTVDANGLMGAKLLLNGESVEGKRNVFEVEDDAGVTITVEFKHALSDVVPQVSIDYGEFFAIVDPIPWYGRVLGALPMGMVFIGGLVGGGLGAVASVGTLYVWRSKLPVWAQILLSLVFTGAAAAIYMLFVLIITIVRT